MNKKNILIIILISIVLIIGLAIYFFSCNNQTSQQAKIETVIDYDIFYPNIVENNAYFLSDIGIIWYKYNFDNQSSEQLFNDEILGPQEIIYSKDGKYAAVYSDYPEFNVKVYDFEKNQINNLDNNVGYISFMQDKLLYDYHKTDQSDSGEKTYVHGISTSNIDGTDYKSVKTIKSSQDIGVILYVKDNDTYFYQITPENGYDGATLYKTYISNPDREDRITAENSVYSEVLFSDDYKYIAYLDQNGSLVIQDLEKIEEVTETDIQVSSIDQIIFSSNNASIYYLADLNSLIRIDTKNLKQTKYTLDNAEIDNTNLLDENISNLFLSEDDSVLYFTYNNYLYLIQLK